MFQVFKNGRPAGNKKYSTYEKARQAVRKTIRKSQLWFLNTTGNNPTYSFYGYSIRKV